MLILISDAFDAILPQLLSKYGEVTDDKGRVAEAEIVLIRSKTKVTKEYIDSAPNLKLVIRGGVGLDNIADETEGGCVPKGVGKASREIRHQHHVTGLD